MRKRAGFIRPGREDFIEIRDMYTEIDYYSIVLYYELMKEEGNSLPTLLEDIGKAPPEKLIEGLENIINSMLAEFVKIKRPLIEYTDISGQEKAFDFIMHDPLLKQAIGDVTLRVFMRDKRINHEVAIQKVKKVLTEVRGNFLAVFLLELMELILPQILQIMEKHSIDAKELLRMGGPIIMSILPATHT